MSAVATPRRSGSVGRLDRATLADLVRFARVVAASKDIAPWADVLRNCYLAGDLTREEALWVLTLYNTYDDIGSAWKCFRRWPTIHDWAAAGPAERATSAEWPCTQERRNLRGGLVVKRHASYAAVLERNGLVAGQSTEPWLWLPLQGDSPGADFARLTKQMREVWGVGRQSAFEWAEFAGKVLALPVDAADGQLWESSGPRRSLERIYGNPSPTPGWLDRTAIAAKEALASAGVELAWVDFETVICDFNVSRDGRYYPGRHLAALKAEIASVPGGPRDRGALERAWTASIPEPWASISPGIDERWLATYRDTGWVIDTPTPEDGRLSK